MFINFIHVSLYDISFMQNILYQINRDVAVALAANLVANSGNTIFGPGVGVIMTHCAARINFGFGHPLSRNFLRNYSLIKCTFQRNQICFTAGEYVFCVESGLLSFVSPPQGGVGWKSIGQHEWKNYCIVYKEFLG